MNNNKKILLVGGGTGGHVTPLMAVIEELLAAGIPSSSIFLVTDKQSAKLDYIQGHQIEVCTITGGKFNRFFTLANLLAPFKVMAGFYESLILLRRIRPTVVLAKGAYLSAPLVFAASLLKIPVYLHESDSIMGASNRRLAKYAQRIFVSFPIDFYPQEFKDKLVFSGLPIRKRFFLVPHRTFHFVSGRADVGSSTLKKILIWGGSQGADKLNRLIIERLSDYLKNYEIYHICGEKNLGYCQSAKSNFTSELQTRYHLYGFLGREIEKIVAGCDLVISRAGATSLFELAAMGKAVITIPYPYAASDHQTKNAHYFQEKEAIVFLAEKNLDEEKLKREVYSLLEDNRKRYELAENIKKLAPQKAASIIVEHLIK